MGVVWSWLNQYLGHLTSKGDVDAQDWSLDFKNIDDCESLVYQPVHPTRDMGPAWTMASNGI